MTDACDGFNVMFPFLPDGLDDFVGLLTAQGFGRDAAPPLQSPLAWLQAEGHL